VSQGYFHHELQKKVLETFDTGYTNENGLRELVEKAKDLLQGLDLMREKSLVQRLMEEIREENGGLAMYGEAQVRHALDLGAVDTVLISEGLRKLRFKVRCTNCGNEENKTLADETTLPPCPRCGGTYEVVEKRDIVEELSGLAGRTNTKVELISKDSDEGQLLLKAFGGLAAVLRYRVT